MEYKPLKINVNHPSLPKEMLLFRDFDMIEDFIERFPGIDARRLGRLAVSLFRGNEDYPDAAEEDYFGVAQKVGDLVTWHLFYDHPEQIAYFSGVAFGHERQHIYHQMLRANDFKTFQEKFGWFPQLIIDDVPTESERQGYADWILSEAGELEEDFEKSLRDENEG